MQEHVTTVLVQAGMSHEMAQMVVATYTMAQTLADLQQQVLMQRQEPPAPPEPTDEGGDAP